MYLSMSMDSTQLLQKTLGGGGGWGLQCFHGNKVSNGFQNILSCGMCMQILLSLS